jgi:hypothetical protein
MNSMPFKIAKASAILFFLEPILQANFWRASPPRLYTIPPNPNGQGFPFESPGMLVRDDFKDGN